jgi:biopolymer transport protein ExbB
MTNLSQLKEKHFKRQLSAFVISAIVIVLSLMVVPELFAQDGAAGDGAAAAPAATSLWDQIVAGGGWMVIEGVLSVLMVTLIVFNFMQLGKGKFCPDDLRLTLLDHMQNCRVRSAIEVASMSPTYLGRMMASSLPAVDATDPETLGREAVEDHMAEFTIRENRGHMQWIGYFSVLSQIAPMLGLLGTVVGMMQAFGKLSATAGAKADALAGDISLAMVTTMGGLMIAIPCVVAYFFFKNRLNKLVSDCHQAAGEMIDASIATVNADQIMAKVPEGLSEG